MHQNNDAAGAADTRDRSGEHEAVEEVPIEILLPADSPRLNGTDDEHVKNLADSRESLPPILVQRSSMRVIDGMHRLRVARMRGAATIRVRFYDGDDAASFVKGVTANIRHGLPLSRADREAAARRIIGSHPYWSDRAIATATGISAKSVRGIRDCLTAAGQQLDARVGKDGKVRPINGAVGRRLAADVLASKPHASLREVARIAGVSPSTVRDVRDRIRRGEDPVTRTQRAARDPEPAGAGRGAPTPGLAEAQDVMAIVAKLKRDPSVRHKESGRALLRWLERLVTDRDEGVRLLEAVPPHCMVLVAQLVRSYAADWDRLAREIAQRSMRMS